MTTETGFDLAFGTYDEAAAMIGTRSAAQPADFEVCRGMIRHFCAMVHDPSPAYWDDEWATQRWGGVVSPPAMTMVWLMPIEWRPGDGHAPPRLPALVPLPGTSLINVSNDAEFHAPLLVGEQLEVVEELVNVSPEKRTGLGVGHFVTTRAQYRSATSSRVYATITNVMLRFTPGQ